LPKKHEIEYSINVIIIVVSKRELLGKELVFDFKLLNFKLGIRMDIEEIWK